MVLAGEHAAPGLMILVGLVAIASGSLGLWRWGTPAKAWRTEDQLVPRLELACAALVVFGLTSLAVGVAGA